MPATVLEILQEDGVYPNLYFGNNMVEKVRRTCTNRTGGIEPCLQRRRVAPPTRWSFRGSTIARKSGSMVTKPQTMNKSLGCMRRTS